MTTDARKGWKRPEAGGERDEGNRSEKFTRTETTQDIEFARECVRRRNIAGRSPSIITEYRLQTFHSNQSHFEHKKLTTTTPALPTQPAPTYTILSAGPSRPAPASNNTTSCDGCTVI